MRYGKASIAIAIFALLSPPQLFAACPNITGPHNWPTCAATYYLYDLSECASTSQSGANACNIAGYEYDYESPGGEAWTSYSFTVSGSGGTNWQLSHRVDFSDTTNSQWNWIFLQVTVVRSGSTIYSNTFFTHNGTQGDFTCAQPTVSSFSAQNGDVINIAVGTQAIDPNTTIRVSDPTLLRFAC